LISIAKPAEKPMKEPKGTDVQPAHQPVVFAFENHSLICNDALADSISFMNSHEAMVAITIGITQIKPAFASQNVAV
jgi:hypothetical protein